ncbi:hypothetical protein C8R44DRAFT_988666 [Mycena epipterygia]|nr:hypothetical protein C8R44DRAFT_988666 [Mycena epipterygia]
MPPRTRQGGRRLMALGIPINTTGLPSLPVEILHEIVSHLCAVPVPCSYYHVLSRTYLERAQALRALSETCQRLRTVFLAYAWERLEVCASPKVSDVYVYKGRQRPPKYRWQIWSKDLALEFARELVRQTEIVTVRNPALAKEVRITTVVLSEWSAATVFPEFFRCLSLLPNLHTIQLLRAPHDGYGRLELETAAMGYTFPSVRTLVLHSDTEVTDIATRCPNLERLATNAWFSHLQLKNIHESAPNLRTFTRFPLPEEYVQDLVKSLPNLSEIPPIRTNYLNPDTVKLLGSMKNLWKIDFDDTDNDEAVSPSENSQATASLVAAAIQVLRRSSSDAPEKYVTVTFREGEGTTLQRYPCA